MVLDTAETLLKTCQWSTVCDFLRFTQQLTPYFPESSKQKFKTKLQTYFHCVPKNAIYVSF